MPEPRANGLLAFISPSKYLLIGGSDRNKSYNDIWYFTLGSFALSFIIY